MAVWPVLLILVTLFSLKVQFFFWFVDVSNKNPTNPMLPMLVGGLF